jgi:hypothetical protein
MLEVCLGRDVDVVSLESLPRMFGFSTGVYTDFSGRMVGALVMDTKLCCALTASIGGLSEERGQELVLLQELPEELLGALDEFFGVMTCAFFLDDGSDRLRCRLQQVLAKPSDIPASMKAFMADPPLYQAYQIGLLGYGEGTLLYIGGENVLSGENSDE